MNKLFSVMLAGAVLITSCTPPQRVEIPEPTPARTPTETPTPVPTPHPAEAANEAAIRLYPDLAKKDSTFNKAFRELYEEQEKKNPASLTTVDWPLTLARHAAAMLGVSSYSPTPTRRPFATPETPPPKGTPDATPKTNLFEGWGTSLDKRPKSSSNGRHTSSSGSGSAQTPRSDLPQERTAGSTNGLPWPVEGHAFTLTELNQYRARIAGQIVWVKLTATGIEPQPVAGEYKVFVSDGKSTGESFDNYAFVWFPKEGAEKMRLLGKTMRGALSFYVKVEKDRLTAVARSRNIDSFHNTFTYTW